MNRKVGFIIGVAALACAAPFACSQTNPGAQCNVGHGDYAAKYLLTTPSGNAACDALKGEIVGLEKYFPADGGPSTVAIMPAAALAAEGDSPAYSLGVLKSEVPESTSDGQFCEVQQLPTITRQVPHEGFTLLEDGGLPPEAVDAGVGFDGGTLDTDAGFLETTPAAPFSYSFSDTRFFVVQTAPSAQQFTTTLTYKDVNAGCTATYKVIAMYPGVSCAKTDPSTGNPLKNADGTFQTDESKCSPDVNVDAGILFGSGINPDFDTICDANTGLCQLKADDIGPVTLKK